MVLSRGDEDAQCQTPRHKVTPGQDRICLEKARDGHDRIIVTEKLYGSNVAAGKIASVIIPLVRAGYRAGSSKYEQHRRLTLQP